MPPNPTPQEQMTPGKTTFTDEMLDSAREELELRRSGISRQIIGMVEMPHGAPGKSDLRNKQEAEIGSALRELPAFKPYAQDQVLWLNFISNVIRVIHRNSDEYRRRWLEDR
jgi:hypothetical protein